jgi:hypothetical protein
MARRLDDTEDRRPPLFDPGGTSARLVLTIRP